MIINSQVVDASNGIHTASIYQNKHRQKGAELVLDICLAVVNGGALSVAVNAVSPPLHETGEVIAELILCVHSATYSAELVPLAVPFDLAIAQNPDSPIAVY